MYIKTTSRTLSFEKMLLGLLLWREYAVKQIEFWRSWRTFYGKHLLQILFLNQFLNGVFEDIKNLFK